MLTSLVSARTDDLHLAMSSLPGLPAAAESAALPPTQISKAMVREVRQPVSRAAQQDSTPQVEAPAGPPPAATATSTAAPEEDTPPAAVAAEESTSEQRVAALTAEDASRSSASIDPPPLYQTYVVQAGDTVSGIAARFGVRTQDIVANNAGVISGQSLLMVGASLQVPSAPGVLHNVHVGETLADIAEQYGVTVEEIVGYPGNKISDPSNVLEGTQLLVVNGEAPVQPAPAQAPEAEAEATPEATPESTETPPPTPEAPPPPAVPSGPAFVWPLQGRITSYFGPSHPKGIDISIAYAPVAASAAGKVVFVGGDPCCSYGYYIDIQHPGGYLTRYGHLSKFLVTLGQQVAQGDTIAISGNTGYSTGAHLHFEIRLNGAVQDPLDFLP